MHRFSLFLKDEQVPSLHEAAARLDKSVGEILRLAVDAYLPVLTSAVSGAEVHSVRAFTSSGEVLISRGY